MNNTLPPNRQIRMLEDASDCLFRKVFERLKQEEAEGVRAQALGISAAAKRSSKTEVSDANKRQKAPEGVEDPPQSFQVGLLFVFMFDGSNSNIELSLYMQQISVTFDHAVRTKIGLYFVDTSNKLSEDPRVGGSLHNSDLLSGDLIVSVNGTKVANKDEVGTAIKALKAGACTIMAHRENPVLDDGGF